ncbi:MAG: class I SAM-dependent methyltransferase [Chloroflexi bacterium]|nr:class I SAM-dependent methyltransferase [Chloroflexota bacterium]
MTHDVAAAYDFAAPQFKSDLAPDSTSRAALEKWSALLSPGARVMDVGCGAGRATRWLEEFGCAVLSLDLSTEMLRRTGEGRPGARVALADMLSLPVTPESFDGLTAFFSVTHIPKVEVPRVLNGFHRALKPGGALLVAVVRGEEEGEEAHHWTGGHVLHFSAFDEAELATLLEAAGFCVIGGHGGEAVFHGQWEKHIFMFARRS